MFNDYIISPNPDFIYRKKIEEEIKENDGYCLNAVEKNEHTRCICDNFKSQQPSGWCKCGQYFKTLKAPIACLCGSTRFQKDFLKVAKELTLEGYNVSMPILFNADDIEALSNEDREFLNEIHKAKIANADLVYIINTHGYIGNTTQDEINWAIRLKKKIIYLEPIIDS